MYDAKTLNAEFRAIVEPYLQKEFKLYQRLRDFYAVSKDMNVWIGRRISEFSGAYVGSNLCWMPKLKEGYRRLDFEDFLNLLEDFKSLYEGGRIIEKREN